MSKANPTIPLSTLFTDQALQSAFWRAEQDLGDDYAALMHVDHPRTLDGGAAALLTGAPFRAARELEGLARG